MLQSLKAYRGADPFNLPPHVAPKKKALAGNLGRRGPQDRPSIQGAKGPSCLQGGIRPAFFSMDDGLRAAAKISSATAVSVICRGAMEGRDVDDNSSLRGN